MAVKSEGQQAILAMHRIRQGLMKTHTATTVALANKMARTIWAVLAHERAYDRDYVSLRPSTIAT